MRDESVPLGKKTTSPTTIQISPIPTLRKKRQVGNSKFATKKLQVGEPPKFPPIHDEERNLPRANEVGLDAATGLVGKFKESKPRVKTCFETLSIFLLTHFTTPTKNSKKLGKNLDELVTILAARCLISRLYCPDQLPPGDKGSG